MAGDRHAPAGRRRAGRRHLFRILLPGRPGAAQRRRPTAGPAKRRRSSWPTSRASIARPPKPPRPRSEAGRWAAAPNCWSRLPRRPRRRKNAAMWLRQLADMISAAVQAGTCSDGADRLKALFDKLQKSDSGQEPGRLRQVPPADRGLRAEHAGAEGRLCQDSDGVAEDAATVHQRLSHGHRCRRGHAPSGHQPGVCRPGGRREEVVRADRQGVPRFGGGQEGGRCRRPGSIRSASRSP